MKYRNLASALLVSALSFLSINAAFAQTSGMPSPIDGQPITNEPSFNLGFGDDDRIPMRSNTYPWSAVGRVQIDDAGHCTGALIGRDLVLTNAHCIFVNGQRRGITFAPNYKNGQSAETVRGAFYWWGTDKPNENRGADWAIIRLERPIGDRYGWFSWKPLNYQELQGKTVTYAGYSTFRDEKVQEFINGETAQVHVGCRVRDVFANDGVIHTDCDNGRGGSGGPIFIWQNNKPIIVGINAAEYRADPDGSSYFTKDYAPGKGNIGVPTLTFAQTILQASSPTSSYDQLNARATGCYYVRSLNDNFRNSNFRWLDAKSDGSRVELVSGQSHGTVWLLEATNQGSLLRSTNQNHRSKGSYRWLDGKSDGTNVQLVADTSHGAFWELDRVGGGYYLRSLNNNFRNSNLRWLDGKSNGEDAKLVGGKSHGTLWELNSTSCP